MGAEKITPVLEGAERQTRDFLKKAKPPGWGREPPF